MGEKIVRLEGKFEDVIEPMADKIGKMYDNWPEVVRKTNTSHEFINSLKADGCPKDHIVKRPSDGNGGYKERRTRKSWRKQWGDTPLFKKVSILVIGVPFFGAYWDWILQRLHGILDVLETVPK